MIILGSTGSIGVNTLLVAEQFGLNVETLVAGSNIELLNAQILKHRPKIVVIANRDDISKVKHNRVLSGERAILEAIEQSSSDLVVNALVGFLGLRPTIRAIELNRRLALANKESLVVAGAFLDKSKIQPIDSEHFGLWYLLQGRPINKMIITASGGAFREWPIEKIAHAKLSDALKHPNWSMGQKITIDSATMVNKLFELLEAKWLFGGSSFDAFIETKSIIHALIEYVDGSSTAHLAHANMRLPIAYALLGEVGEQVLEPVDLAEIGSMEFRKIEIKRYPIWELKDMLLSNPKMGVVINAANEAAISQFISGKIEFGAIARTIIDAMKIYGGAKIDSIETLFEIDTEVRERYGQTGQ